MAGQAPAAALSVSAQVTVTSGRRMRMSTARSRGASQTSSRRAASPRSGTGCRRTGRVEIITNSVENGIRPLKLIAKKAMFAGQQ